MLGVWKYRTNLIYQIEPFQFLIQETKLYFDGGVLDFPKRTMVIVLRYSIGSIWSGKKAKFWQTLMIGMRKKAKIEEEKVKIKSLVQLFYWEYQCKTSGLLNNVKVQRKWSLLAKEVSHYWLALLQINTFPPERRSLLVLHYWLKIGFLQNVHWCTWNKALARRGILSNLAKCTIWNMDQVHPHFSLAP